MEKQFTAAISQEWTGQKVKVVTSIFFSNEIKGILSEIGTNYIVVGQNIINVRHIVKVRKA